MMFQYYPRLRNIFFTQLGLKVIGYLLIVQARVETGRVSMRTVETMLVNEQA